MTTSTLLRLCLVAGAMAVTASPGRAGAQAPAPEFRSAAEARAWLTREGMSATPDSLLAFLSGDDPLSVDVMRAYVALGLPVNAPSAGSGLRPLTLITRSCVGNAMAPKTTAVLIAGGANPTLTAPDGDKATALMEAVNCPAVLQAMMVRKPDLSTVDAKGYTLMHHALNSHEAREEAVRIVREAGFDVARWRPSLNKEFGHLPNLAAMLDGANPTAKAPAPAAASATAIDWTALGPYPARSAAEATRLLSRPGADTTIDDHFWDAIQRAQPQRLAVALQAGANVRQVNRGNGYTPLMQLADFCDDKKADLQLSVAEQLIAAKADAAAVTPTGSTALIIGASRCSVPVLRALIAAGAPVSSADANGTTALKQAIVGSRVDLIALLIDAGVDPRREPYNTGKFAAGNKAVQDALKRRPRQ